MNAIYFKFHTVYLFMLFVNLFTLYIIHMFCVITKSDSNVV